LLLYAENWRDQTLTGLEWWISAAANTVSTYVIRMTEIEMRSLLSENAGTPERGTFEAFCGDLCLQATLFSFHETLFDLRYSVLYFLCEPGRGGLLVYF